MKSTIAMSRGILVLDENLLDLKDFLIERNIKVIVPRNGLSDDAIMQELLSHRIFLTANSKDFIHEVSSYEFGLISADNVKNTPAKELAGIVSKAIIAYSLWAKRHGFLLVLRQDGKHQYKDLTE
jgi:hypothetical protein